LLALTRLFEELCVNLKFHETENLSILPRHQSFLLSRSIFDVIKHLGKVLSSLFLVRRWNMNTQNAINNVFTRLLGLISAPSLIAFFRDQVDEKKNKIPTLKIATRLARRRTRRRCKWRSVRNAAPVASKNCLKI
jgi:hypothetical protein